MTTVAPEGSTVSDQARDVRTLIDIASVATVAIMVLGAALAVAYAISRPDELAWYQVVSLGYIVVGNTCIVVIARAVLRDDHRNPVGWILGIICLAAVHSVFTNGFTAWEAPGSLVFATIHNAQVGSLIILLPLALLLFPTGRPPSPRWRWLAWLCVGVAAVGFLAGLFSPFPDPPHPVNLYLVENPLAIDALEGVAAAAEGLVLPLALLCLASVVVRFRRAEGVERDQIKVVGYAGVLIVFIALSVAVLAPSSSGDDSPVADYLIGDLIFGLGIIGLPVAIGVGITRYRLYGIDRLMSRTLAWASVVVLVGATYVAVVALITAQLTSGGSVVLAGIAAAGAAAAIRPVRTTVEKWFERRIFGERATARRVMDRFSREIASTPTSTTVLERTAEAVAGLTGAQAVRVVLIGDGEEEMVATAGSPTSDGWDAPLLMEQGDTTIGKIQVSAGDVAPSVRAPLQRLAEGSSAALATLRFQLDLDRLYDEAQVRNRELAASRKRLIEAAESERESMQRVVAEQIDPDIDLLRRHLDGSGPEAGDDGHAGLVEATGRLTRSVRSLARGVLPSLLVDHGLVAAVRAELRRVDAEVELDADPAIAADDIDPEVATTAFLSCRAVMDDARRSEVRSTRVGLHEVDRHMLVVAEHRGRRLAPEDAGLVIARDRVLALGGVAELDAGPDNVSLRAEIPLAPEPSA